MPGGHGHEQPLSQQRTGDLWLRIFGPQLLFGVLLSSICASRARPDPPIPAWVAVTLWVAFSGLLLVLLGGQTLGELARRERSLPPGSGRTAGGQRSE